MRIGVARYAISRFRELQTEHAEVIAAIGLPALVCLVRQKGMDSDNGWVCHEVGLSDQGEGEAFWGRFKEVRSDIAKEILIIIDLEDIDSIEFEIYEQPPIES